MSHHILDSLEVYLDNIAAAATQTAATGGPLAELVASLAVYMDTVARQQIEIKWLTEKINALKKNLQSRLGFQTQGEITQTTQIASILQRWDDWLHTATTSVTLTNAKIRKEWVGQQSLWRLKGLYAMMNDMWGRIKQ